MKKIIWLVIALFSATVHAYTARELLDDCRVAEELPLEKPATDPVLALKSRRCQAYVSGFADGYTLSDRLAEKIGVRIGAFCLPNDPELLHRLVRAVVIHVERVPPDTTVGTATLVAGALAKSFPCSETLESKK